MSNETDPSEQEMKQVDEIEREADAAIRELDARQIDNLLFAAEVICISRELDDEIRHSAEDDLIFEAEDICLSAEINYELRRIAEQQLIDDIEEELNE